MVAGARLFEQTFGFSNAYKLGAENSLVFPWRGWHLKGITHPHFGEDEVTVFAIALESEVRS